MSDTPPVDSGESLPTTLPIFPLTGVLLLPRGHLPLQIFEPRYRNMTEAALGGDRMIGMVQPREPQPDPLSDTASIYETGCAGRIVSFAETDDRRFLIALRGICRFRIAGELPPFRGFRRVRPDFSRFAEDMLEKAGGRMDRGRVGRDRLVDAVRNFLEAKEMTADWSAIEEASDEALVIALAMGCPLEPREKQALLECPDLASRAELLCTLLEMAVRDGDGTATARPH